MHIVEKKDTGKTSAPKFIDMKKRADLQSNWIKLIGLRHHTSEPPRTHGYRKIEGKILVSGKHEYSPFSADPAPKPHH